MRFDAVRLQNQPRQAREQRVFPIPAVFSLVLLRFLHSHRVTLSRPLSEDCTPGPRGYVEIIRVRLAAEMLCGNPERLCVSFDRQFNRIRVAPAERLHQRDLQLAYQSVDDFVAPSQALSAH